MRHQSYVLVFLLTLSSLLHSAPPVVGIVIGSCVGAVCVIVCYKDCTSNNYLSHCLTGRLQSQSSDVITRPPEYQPSTYIQPVQQVQPADREHTPPPAYPGLPVAADNQSLLALTTAHMPSNQTPPKHQTN